MEASEAKEEKATATAYQALTDVTIPRVIARVGEGENAETVTESVNYPAGSVVMADSLTARDQERVTGGELAHLLRPLSEDEAKQAGNVPAGEPEFGIFIPEHEAEAHALEQYGHVVVPKEQELEALSSGADYAAAYQSQVKAAGLDARPNLEASNPANRQRVPDQLLLGAETAGGLPHNRGPAESGSAAESSEEKSEEGGDEATRPAPPVSGEADPQTVGG
jgi:hypothetical protein